MTFLLRRAARIAASLTRFARSAPEKPGDWRATPSTSTPLSSGLPLVWTLRIAVAALHVGPVEDDLAVEAAGPQERRVEDVGAVRGGDDDHVRVRVEAVHLDEDLVQGLLALVVASRRGRRRAGGRPRRSRPRRRCTASCAWPGRTGRGRELAPTPTNISTNSEPEMLKNGTPASPATARAISVLPVPGGPTRQHAARDPRAERVELLGVLQELDDFLELGLGLVDAGDVGERHDGLVAEEHPGPALAEAEGLVIRALGLSHHEEDEPADDQDRQEAGDDQAEPAVVGRRLGGRSAGTRHLALGRGGCWMSGSASAEEAGHDDRVLAPPSVGVTVSFEPSWVTSSTLPAWTSSRNDASAE